MKNKNRIHADGWAQGIVEARGLIILYDLAQPHAI